MTKRINGHATEFAVQNLSMSQLMSLKCNIQYKQYTKNK